MEQRTERREHRLPRGHFGDAVSRAMQDGGDPADFVVLTNSDDEEHDDFSAKDFDDATALLTNDQADKDADGNVIDDDLVKLTLSQLPSGLSDGTFTLAASDPSAVRFFDSSGHQLTNVSLNLASPSGYLAGLMSHDVDVWMEGLHKSSDLILKAGYTDPAGNEIARDTVHMLLADLSFAAQNGDSENSVEPVVKQTLFDFANGASSAEGLPDTATYQVKIDGITGGMANELQVTPSANTDTYTAALTVDSTGAAVSEPSVIYSTDHDSPVVPLDSQEHQSINGVLGLDAAAGQSAAYLLDTGNDKQGRRIEAVKKPITPHKDYLIAFHGLLGPGGFGNDYVTKLVAKAEGANGYESKVYEYTQEKDALLWLLQKIDVAPTDHKITQREVDAVTMRVIGYSFGGSEAWNIVSDLKSGQQRFGLLGSEKYILNVPVKVQTLVTIDPRTSGSPLSLLPAIPNLFLQFLPGSEHRHGDVANNFGTFINYYEQGHNSSSIALSDGTTHIEDNGVFNFMPGDTLPGARNMRVDPANSQEHYFDATRTGHIAPNANGQRNVNHQTIPWLVYEDVLNDLAP